MIRCLRDKQKSTKKSKSSKTDSSPLSVATDGIDIMDWKEQVTLENGSKVDVTINTWDFAGQTVYYTTHQFFLSERSVFAVLFDVTDPDLSRLSYWMKSIHSRIAKPTVILVGTHSDCKEASAPGYMDDVSARVNSICQKYRSSVKALLFVSTKTKMNIDILKKTVLTEAMKVCPVSPSFQ